MNPDTKPPPVDPPMSLNKQEKDEFATDIDFMAIKLLDEAPSTPPVATIQNKKRSIASRPLPSKIPESPAEKRLKHRRELMEKKYQAVKQFAPVAQPPSLKNVMKPLEDVRAVVDLTMDSRVSLSFMSVAHGYLGLVKIRSK